MADPSEGARYLYQQWEIAKADIAGWRKQIEERVLQVEQGVLNLRHDVTVAGNGERLLGLERRVIVVERLGYAQMALSSLALAAVVWSARRGVR